MKIIEPSVKILNPPDYNSALRHIEAAARTCYQSEAKDSFPEPFIKRLIKMGHHSVLEHSGISVRFICDRGVSHELVRHRLCSFSQESTRYCNYSGERFGEELTFIAPEWYEPNHQENNNPSYIWKNAMQAAEDRYFKLLCHLTPQGARSVLPNSLKTDIVVTANIRQWRTMFKLRCASAAHPQMRQIMIPLLGAFSEKYPVFFYDLFPMCENGHDFFIEKGWQLAEVKNA